MTRLRIAFLFTAVVAGAYAALELIYGQLTLFAVFAAVCVGLLVTARLIVYVDHRRRQAMARGRAAVWRRRDQQAATAGRQCALCGGACQTASESVCFVDRQLTPLCGTCASDFNPEPT